MDFKLVTRLAAQEVERTALVYFENLVGTLAGRQLTTQERERFLKDTFKDIQEAADRIHSMSTEGKK